MNERRRILFRKICAAAVAVPQQKTASIVITERQTSASCIKNVTWLADGHSEAETEPPQLPLENKRMRQREVLSCPGESHHLSICFSI